MSRLRVLALEPYYGGSHRAVLDTLVANVDADWTLVTLPARKWKWRMRGAAMTMAAKMTSRAQSAADETRADKPPGWDVLFCSTFLNLAEFKGLVGQPLAATPAVVYFHENQLVYPSRHEAEWDYQFPLTNITTALAADRCLFNTAWNLERFLGEADPFLGRFPDHVPHGVGEAIAAKSSVLAPPFDLDPLDEVVGADLGGVRRESKTRIVWPHRWEHDKNPEEFFSAVGRLAEEGLRFEVAVAGQAFKDRPPVFDAIERHLGDRLVHLGEPESRLDYVRLLASSHIAVSTAANEFFGLAMIEAAYAGCFPLVPDRLCYPELYPAEMRYGVGETLIDALRRLIAEPPAPGAARAIAERFTVHRLAPQYEAILRGVAEGRP